MMKQLIYLFLFPACLFAQTPLTVSVDASPEFPKGAKGLFNYLADHLKYPRVAQENGIQGTVYISFTVDEDGSLANIISKRGLGGGCTEEAIRVIKSMPNWIPAKYQGKPVKTEFTLPIRFKLEEPPPPQNYKDVEVPPTFPGGEKRMYQYLANRVQYPAFARENGFEGTVIVDFVILEDGSIWDVQVKQAIGGGCDEEAVRVIEAMPKWIPGMQGGKKVAVAYLLPLKFKLDRKSRK